MRSLFNQPFYLIFNKQNYNKKFVIDELKRLKIQKYKIIILPKVTDGQATTVMAIDKHMKPDDSIVIYNVDTFIKPGIINKNIFKHDGNITTAKAKGDHWSFVKLGRNGLATATSEKIRISSNCSIGSYYFKYWSDFKTVYKKFRHEIKKQFKEAYIAPMYQYLININKKIGVHNIKMSDIVSLGTPKEVLKFDKYFAKNNR
ncbi:MAG: hypothetical protein LBD63_02080 [Mycoplasmataceae bacterium]|nr:hypothetical protein [Mycoplasmataceae bacterium]